MSYLPSLSPNYTNLTLDLSPSTCGKTLGDTAFPQCLIISNVSIICPCHLDIPQNLYHRVTPGLPRSPRSSFAIFWKPCQCFMCYSSVVHSMYMSQPLWNEKIRQRSYLLVSDFISPCVSQYPTHCSVHCEAYNRLIFTTVIFYVSAPYRSVATTSASYNCILVLTPSLLFF